MLNSDRRDESIHPNKYTYWNIGAEDKEMHELEQPVNSEFSIVFLCNDRKNTRALFSSEKFSNFDTVAFLFVCVKYCPIIN